MLHMGLVANPRHILQDQTGTCHIGHIWCNAGRCHHDYHLKTMKDNSDVDKDLYSLLNRYYQGHFITKSMLFCHFVDEFPKVVSFS